MGLIAFVRPAYAVSRPISGDAIIFSSGITHDSYLDADAPLYLGLYVHKATHLSHTTMLHLCLFHFRSGAE